MLKYCTAGRPTPGKTRAGCPISLGNQDKCHLESVRPQALPPSPSCNIIYYKGRPGRCLKGQPRVGSRLTLALHPNQVGLGAGFSPGWIKMWIAMAGLKTPTMLGHTCARGP